MVSSLVGDVTTQLPLEIAAATRTYHTNLNRLIMARLPLCLPPYAQSPSTYAFGFGFFGQIYCSFEAAWEDLITRVDAYPAAEEDRVAVDLLQTLYTPSLLRSKRICDDLARLPEHPVSGLDVKLRLQDWREEILNDISARPHNLLAFAWVMYMALFNGGRWIRSQLLNAGDDFWNPGAADVSPLSFWSFAGDDDSDSIAPLKNAFRSKFEDVAAHMSDRQRTDIVHQAVRIFDMCAEMVSVLDQLIDRQKQPLESQSQPLAVSEGSDDGGGPQSQISHAWPFRSFLNVLAILRGSWISLCTLVVTWCQRTSGVPRILGKESHQD